MKGMIAELFGVIVKFDGGMYVYNPNTGKYLEVK